MMLSVTIIVSWFGFLLGCFAVSIVDALHVVKVCQNKHCCKRAATVDVLQTMQNLADTNIQVEASGCLSHCDKGPNVEVTQADGTIALLHGMKDAKACILEWGVAELPPIPKILVAATKVMEQSQTLESNDDRIRFLSSVIGKLEETSAKTPGIAHAHALRAKAYLEQGGESLEAAIRDAQTVTQDFLQVATPTSLSLAYRTWADALLLEEEQRRDQQQADFSEVVAVLTTWQKDQPMYRTKLQREIQELGSSVSM